MGHRNSARVGLRAAGTPRGGSTRRILVRSLCALFFVWPLILLPGIEASAVSSREKPNILFILSDDHRWDFLSAAGHSFVQTPNLDRLADQGVFFSNAFVTTSLCSPSRASFLTGQYAHTHGVRNNLTPWRDENITFIELLKQAGYDTAFIGKWHMPGRLPKLRGVDRFLTFTIQEGQGRYWDCPLIVDGVETPSRKPYITEELTDYALAFMEKPRNRPFCLYLSHKAAHHEFSPPADLANLYQEAKLPLPRHAVPWINWVRGHLWTGTMGSMDVLYRNYSRVIVGLDREIGRLLRRIEELGIAENTLVVYAGDNGYFWGEHGFLDKRWPYEEAIRIPFIVRHPGRISEPGRKAHQMVLNIDLAPTILEAAGLPVPSNMEGESFMPILRSASAQGRKAWLYEHFKEFPYNVPEIRAVRTDQHMYAQFGGRRAPELYDIVADPRQESNLIGTAEGERLLPQLQEMLETLQKARRLR